MDANSGKNALRDVGLGQDALLEKAERLTCSSVTAAAVGNTIAMYALLVDQMTLALLAADPVANAASIADLSNSIASLNASIRVLSTRGV